MKDVDTHFPLYLKRVFLLMSMQNGFTFNVTNIVEDHYYMLKHAQSMTLIRSDFKFKVFHTNTQFYRPPLGEMGICNGSIQF